jgi:3,4-dihydroxy 2-butanone 4-phosphate synthase/GTP cyclohydrolase II
MVVLTDDESRENEGDLILPAQFATPDAIHFMIGAARGYLCLCLPEADCDRLDLRPQGSANTSVRGTAFTVSIDGAPKHGVGTGVSAHDRARTIQLAIDPATGPADFVVPGHINPLRSRDGGVLVRIGQTEGSVDLCRLAGLRPAAVLLEIVRDDGQMARIPDLEKFCTKHEVKMCSVAQIIEHRLSRETLVHRLAPERGTPLRTDLGDFTLFAFESAVDPLPHLSLTVGGVGELDARGAVVQRDAPTLVRMHRRNLLGDIFGDVASSPTGATSGHLRSAMRRIQDEGAGAIVYLRPEGAGDDLHNRLLTIRREPALAAAGAVGAGRPAHAARAPRNAPIDHSDVPMEQRQFGVGGQILRALGLSRLRLMTNSPKALPNLGAFGLEVVETVPLGE